ncbi:MAG: phospho-N-acetylmuramoyl-pentapeptide-transferase [Proteobacteria bacterium]|jgi:phospho-N-acetylmuramoyl-pentapeptide-transferase|nr:phospho-N-acetylmuramoyl-pentapeptide-transferase [Pseudomonadota bacterium]RZO99408.1 MAG: phospho-N-acetylmuramoyl-pentapeptide-transferase [Gammaproteobacteria bacterium]|tara:strand:+ start:1056 stop:2138 length:1083 start_codon:yes stop_codon:yes gene_type:complete
MLLPFLDFLAESYGPFRIFNYFTFRAILATLTSLIFCLVFGKYFISFLERKNFGQVIRELGPEKHYEKKGTPTMGGILILAAVLFSCICWGDLNNRYLWSIIFLIISFGALGFLDDFLKLKYNSSDGLSAKLKIFWQLVFATIIATYLYLTHTIPQEISLFLPFLKDFALNLGIFFIFFSVFVIIGTSNAVNLTDGLDGLAIMPSVMVAGGLGIIAYISGNIIFADYLNIVYLSGTEELLIICGTIIGAGIGFLWFNTYPAQIFMGDVGSLSLGAALGGMAVILRQEVILAIMGGVFVIEALSVIIQVTSFKLTGKRVFKMSPIHHHFELSGWAEPKIIVRFWIITLILVLIALATFRLR